MNLKRGYFHLAPSIVVMTALILSACQDGSQRYSPRVAGGNKAGDAKTESKAVPTKLTAEQQRFVTDPTTLPPYEQFLKPILAPWAPLFKVKKWIIGPMDLASKEKVGSLSLSPDKENTKVILARQTQYEVWIDAKSIESKNDKDKSDLILNEFLTSLYTLRNLSNDQLCSVLKDIGIKAECKLTASTVSGKKDILVAVDYENISAVKDYVVEQGTNLTEENLLKKMTEKGFDVRIFGIKLTDVDVQIPGSPSAPTSVPEATTVSGQPLDLLFAQAKTWSTSKVTCYLLNMIKQTDCEISVERNAQEVANSEPLQALGYGVKADGEKENFLAVSVYQAKEVKFFKYTDAATKEEVYFLPLTGAYLKNPVVGMPFSMNYMVAKKTQDALEFAGFINIPGVVTTVTPNEDKTKNVCQGSLVEAKDKKTDMVFIGKSDRYLNVIKQGLSKGLKAVPPCW